MSEEQIRNYIVAKARSKYIPGTTMNISVALKLYLEKDATEDEQIPLIVSRENRPKNWVDKIGRPDCPVCGEILFISLRDGFWSCKRCSFKKRFKTKSCSNCSTTMKLSPVNTVPGDQTGDDSNSVWICPKCFETIYTKLTMKELFAEGD